MNKIIDYKTVFHLMENTYLNAELPRKKGFLGIIFYWIVTLVSRTLLELSYIGLLRQYLAHFKNYLT